MPQLCQLRVVAPVIAALLTLGTPATARPGDEQARPAEATSQAAQAPPAGLPVIPPVTSPTHPPAPSPSPGLPTPVASPQRRALPQPFDGIFALTEFLGPTVGVPRDTTAYPLMRLLGLDGDKVAGGLRIYGWVDAGGSWNTSRRSGYPQAYTVAPNQVVLDQAVLSIERLPDTAQTSHEDWGFNLTGLYGIDYRWTMARGWVSEQQYTYNRLYGFDPITAYVQYYIPQLAQGCLLTLGRTISPSDIETPLAPQSFLYTHSILGELDAYTHTGINAQLKLDDSWSLQLGLNAGADTAPWDAGGHLTGQALARWVAPDNRDSLLFGVASLNGGQFTRGKDNLQQLNATWTHKLDDTVHIMTEVYHLYSFNARVGGTVNNGPVKAFGPFGGGPGAYLPGRSTAQGAVSYTNVKLDDSSTMTFRADYVADPRGWRSGFAGSYGSLTLGYCKHLSDTTTVRPEVRWERSFDQPAYDNGTRRTQWSFNADVIQRF